MDDFHSFGYRILKNSWGYGLFEIFYDEEGNMISIKEEPESGYFATEADLREFYKPKNIKAYYDTVKEGLNNYVAIEDPFLYERGFLFEFEPQNAA